MRTLLILAGVLLPALTGGFTGASYFTLRMMDAALSGPSLLQAALFTTFSSGPVLLSGRFWIRSPKWQDAWILCRGLCKVLILLPFWMHFESGLLLPLQLNANGAANIVRTAVFLYGRLFLDFSGYSDCVTGLSGLLGIRVRNNFNRPYLASSLRAFWLRWHATLGDFFRKHLYPSRANSSVRSWALVGIFLAVGLWHGTALHFVVWGGMHGAALLLEKHILFPVGRILKGRFGSTAARIYGTILTQTFAAISWIVFFWK